MAGAALGQSLTAPALRRPLSGADAFARVLDGESRRGGLAGFQSLVLIDVDRCPDIDAIRAAVAADTQIARSLRGRLARRLPFFRPQWDLSGRAPPPRVDLLDAPPPGGAPWAQLLDDRLRPDRGENVRFTVFPDDEGGWRVAFVFHHVMFDARAAERLLVALTAGETAGAWPPWTTAASTLGLGERMRLTRAQSEAIEAAAEGGVHVLAGPDDGAVAGVAGRCIALDPLRTKEGIRRGRAAAGYGMEGLWCLASLLAADRATDPRPPRGARYVVPLPTTLDRVGEGERTFGNRLYFNFLSVPVADADRPAETARSLRDQVMAGLRDDVAVRCSAQLEVCRPIPSPLYARLARGTSGGAFASVFFSNPGAVDKRLASFFGARVREIAHLPTPMPVPGVCATVWSFDGRTSLGLTWVRGRVQDARAVALLDRWAAIYAGDGTTP